MIIDTTITKIEKQMEEAQQIFYPGGVGVPDNIIREVILNGFTQSEHRRNCVTERYPVQWKRLSDSEDIKHALAYCGASPPYLRWTNSCYYTLYERWINDLNIRRWEGDKIEDYEIVCKWEQVGRTVSRETSAQDHYIEYKWVPVGMEFEDSPSITKWLRRASDDFHRIKER